MWCRQNSVFGRASEMSPAARQVLQRLGRVFLWFVAGAGHLVVGGVEVVVMGGAGFMDASSSAASQFLTHCWWARVFVLGGLGGLVVMNSLSDSVKSSASNASQTASGGPASWAAVYGTVWSLGSASMPRLCPNGSSSKSSCGGCVFTAAATAAAVGKRGDRKSELGLQFTGGCTCGGGGVAGGRGVGGAASVGGYRGP